MVMKNIYTLVKVQLNAKQFEALQFCTNCNDDEITVKVDDCIRILHPFMTEEEKVLAQNVDYLLFTK